MKKVSLLILLVIVLSTVLMAAVPVKMIRLTMVNKSEYDVYLKLEGSDVSEAFYYLTVPAGDRDAPEVKVFTIMVDKYAATLWTCDGFQSSYDFLAVSNTRLTFTPCYEKLPEVTHYLYEFPPFVSTTKWYDDLNGDGELDKGEELWYDSKTKSKAGEPTLEKVAAFRYLSRGAPAWEDANLYTGYWNWGCTTFYWRSRTYRRPTTCWFRFQD